MHFSLAWSFVSLGFSGFEMGRCLMSQGLRRLQSCFSRRSRSTIHVFYILPAQYIQSQASVLHLQSDHLTCRQLKLQPDAPSLIVPDRLFPRLALSSLSLLPLLLLTPPQSAAAPLHPAPRQSSARQLQSSSRAACPGAPDRWRSCRCRGARARRRRASYLGSRRGLARPGWVAAGVEEARRLW
jgi:hypothetical protein